MTGTITRLMDVIEALADDPGGTHLADIARHAGLTPSGAHRALSALIEAGVASQVRPRGPYRLGPRVLNWSRRPTPESRLLACAEDALRRAREATGESVALTVLRDRAMWVIATLVGTSGVVMPVTGPGERFFHTSARGLVFLAHLPREQARAIIRDTGLPAVGARPILGEERLWSLVDRARRAGLLWRRDTVEHGTSGVAVPVLDESGEILACVITAMPTTRLSAARRALIESSAVLAARSIEAEWGRAETSPIGD